MTDSMNFGPEWLRNLSSEGSTAGGSTGGTRYQLADFRYGREEMLALFEKGLRPPTSLSTFAPLYSEQVLPPLALIPQADEERTWQSRSIPPGGIIRGRGGSLERGRASRGRPYQTYGRGGYDASGGWGVGAETTEWSPRKDYNARGSSVDNWRRNRGPDEDEGWRASNPQPRGPLEKWGRSTSWREGEGNEERGPPERSNRGSWQEGIRGHPHRRPWDEDHLPEWAMENPSESGGTFDATGAFHGSDDEQREIKASQPHKREIPLQKSVSQQNIVIKTHPTTLPSSQSAISLSKPPDENLLIEVKEKTFQGSGDYQQLDDKEQDEIISNIEIKSSNKVIPDIQKNPQKHQNRPKPEQPTHNKHLDRQNDTIHNINNADLNGVLDTNSNMNNNNNRVDEEFERMQEDLVKKLVVDEETPKKHNLEESFNLSGAPNPTLPPPNLTQPAQDKWYYQDPQGDLQGPFLPSEMAEWFRAGYFTSQLLVKRLCDDSFFLLGDLVNICSGNPFLCNIRINPLTKEVPNVPDNELLQFQMLQRQMAFRQASTMRPLNQPESWGNLPTLPQRELLTQQVLTHPQITQEMQYLQQQQPQQHQQNATNPLMQMISQMQQANKPPGQTLGDKPPNNLPSQLDPLQALVQQMGGLQPLHNNLQPGHNSVNLQNNGLPTNLQNSNLLSSFPNIPLNTTGGPLPVPVGLNAGAGGLLVGTAGMAIPSGIPGGSVLGNKLGLSGKDGLSGTGGLTSSGLPAGLQNDLPNVLSDNNVLPPRPTPLGAVDPLSSNDNESFKTLLRQLATKQRTPQGDMLLWGTLANTQAKPQWHQQNDVPISMWDMQTPVIATSVPSSLPSDKSISSAEQLKNQEKERQKLLKEEQRKRELDEKQAKKDAEERRKEEQRKQEAERKAAEEKRKKEEELIRKEIERIKKEAEEKRLKELEEKRRLKEQRKAEEETRKKIEEQRRLEDLERAQHEAKEREECLRRQLEAARQENNAKSPRVAPWCQANSTPELSLADIQKAEREKRAEQAALFQQQKTQQVLQEQQIVTEKQTMHLNWAKKPPEPRKVKSLAEIQQEEQDRLAKQAAEARIVHQKEKEAAATIPIITSLPWSGQNLSWANTASHWSAAPGGFWDETSLQKSPNKPSSVSKSNSTSAVNINKQPVKQNKSKTKKEEQQVMKLFSNGPVTDEFMEWCTMALTKLNSTVDIPTFISFLRDIESALEVRDYCREYLGEGPTTQQFAAQFLEKRRMIKPKIVTQKDDMSSPAPAITPSIQHSTDFQEVKGKGKKTKKSKMTKVDSRILGFSVTAAPDRLNVGDRDYVEN